MTDKISRYINGEFDYESGSLVFSCSKIEINIRQGETVNGSFTIEEQSGREVSGQVYSTNLILNCPKENFAGKETEVSYCVDATGKIPGDVIKGEIQIISDMGEYVIPYVINVIHETIESSIGNIKNLFHFANLAKSNWEEAVKLFYHDNFISVLTGNDARYRSLYKGLTVCGNPNRNLEEFLIGINKKKAIEFEVDKNVIKLINPDSHSQQTLRISRVGWGYLKLRVEAEGSFIIPERRMLTDDDFLGNICEYHFYIDENALHEGNNFGRIRFYHSYGSFETTVQVIRRLEGKKLHASHRDKRLTYSLTRYYLDFRMKRLSMQKWFAQTKELLEHYRNPESDNIDSSLFEAHLLITQEHYNEAKWILDHAVQDPERLDDTRYCYYLYLTSLYNADEYYARQIADKVMAIYKKNPGNWRIAWLSLFLQGNSNKNAAARWNFALQQIENGCCSPVFYLEALQILNNEPSLLIHLEEAELRLLQFGAKVQFLSSELMQQITDIAARTKKYDVRLVRILMMIYKSRPKEETLRVICMLLMKGERCDKECFCWYEKGVEQNLAITKLYEYYMLSMDLEAEHEIQKKALMYFSYQCTLPGEYVAYLYHYVARYKDKLGGLYEAYQPQIARFLVKQLYAGKINKDLAYLYQEVLLKEMATPDNIQQFAELMFVNRITVDNPRITGIVVRDDRMCEEMVYPVVNQNAFVKLFSNEHTIFLEDMDGNRYFGMQDYQTECYFLPRKIAAWINDYAKDSIPFNLYICGGNREFLTVTPRNVERCRYLLPLKELEEEYRQIICMSLLNYYFEQDRTQNLETILQNIEPLRVPYKNRNEVVKYLSIYGFYKKAYDFTVSYGPENIEAKTIVRFCSQFLEQEEVLENRAMTCMLYSAFERGKYNEIVLEYLIRSYKGLSKNLRNIWKAAVSFEVDDYAICERLLLQPLQTSAFLGDVEQIYKNFVRSAVKTDINLAYLSYKSYEYLVHDRIAQEYVFEGIDSLYGLYKEVPDVCMLSYLKFYSQKVSQLSETQQKMCETFLHILYGGKNIIMPFFAEYKELSTDAAQIANSVIIEYKGNPKSTVVIHYIISREEEENSDYVREEMKNMFDGIFVKEFLLFFGETLQYYVTEAHANREQLTESGTIQKSDALPEYSSDRYAMVNDIAIATTLKDYSTARELLREYAKKDFMAESLFSLQ